MTIHTSKIRIFLGDDHIMFRDMLKHYLSGLPDMDVVGEAGTAQEVLDCLEKIDVDVLVLDIAMPGRDGIELAHDVRQRYPHTHVLILSMHPEDQYASRAIRAGAAGYLTKSKSSAVLLEAIRKIASGRKYISPEVAEQLAVDMEFDAVKPIHQKLSNREYEVMTKIASGKTVKQIALELDLSVSSVSTMRARILKKFGMTTNAEITHYAIRSGLVE